MHPNFAGGERGDNEALSAHTKALLDWIQQRFLLFIVRFADRSGTVNLPRQRIEWRLKLCFNACHSTT
jgi:hypothetical protein